VYEVRQYLTRDGKTVFAEWFENLRDRKAQIAIDRRLIRISSGNFGDHKFCQSGVWELRIDVGPGYRVYYAVEGEKIVLLLAGGDKKTQSADIDRACNRWRDWQARSEL